MSKYIPSITPLTESKMPLVKYTSTVNAFITTSQADICFSDHQEQIILSAVSGDKENTIRAKKLFQGLGLEKKFRGYLFSYLVLEASKKHNHLVTLRQIKNAYKQIFGNACHPDYPLLVANYGGYYVCPTGEGQPYDVQVTVETVNRANVVADMLLAVSKSNRKVKANTPTKYSEDTIQTLEELEATNKELEQNDMEYVFQYANTHGLLKELMETLANSTPDSDLQRSVDLFADNSTLYGFFSFMRSKGISIA